MSSLSSSSKQQDTNTSTSSTTRPLEWQATHLRDIFGNAKTAYGEASAVDRPDNFVAQFTPDQLAIFHKMMGGAGGAGDNLLNIGATATADSLGALGAFTPKGGTDYNIDAAGRYSNNPSISGMVDAAMRDSVRTANESTLPAIGRDAALTGNVNSNKRAISEGIVQRGLNDKAADVSATLRGNAYDTGLKLAQSEADASNDAMLKALLGRVSGGAGATQTGAGLFDTATRGVAGLQDARQAGLNEQLQSYQFGTQAPFDALNNYFNIIGAKNWGSKTSGTSTSSTTQTSTPSTLDTIGKLVGMAGAIGGSQGFNFLPSDRRIKRDIAEIGITHDGLPIYRYTYVNDDTRTTHIGLMAQDVERVFPEAVVTINGVKHVNYDLATREAVVN